MHATRINSANVHGSVDLNRLLPGATRTGTGNVFAQSCTSQWQLVQPGDVFVALPELVDNEEDGHRCVREAVARGAVAVICESPVPVFEIPTYLVDDSRIAYGRLCQALAGFPAQSLEVVAVTGTHGKSTVIALLDSIFALAGKHCGKISGLGCYDGMSHAAGIELPAAPELASRLERMVAAGCTHAFVEVSSEALGNRSFAGIEFDSICVTNVSDAHLDLHNSVQSYRKLKKSILQYVAPTGMVTLNADDPVSIKWLTHVEGPALTFGTKGQAEVTGQVISEHSNELEFTISAGNQTVAIRTSMIGEHHVSNCLAAATVALSHGIDLQTIAAGIEAVENLPGRMERVDCGQGFPVFVDAADTAESLRASLRSARHLTTGRVICVLGDPKNATYSEQLAIAHVVTRLADVAIISRPFPAEELSVRDSQQRARVEVVEDRRRAIACALSVAQTGDVVVIAGSRCEPQKAYGTFALSAEKGDASTARNFLYSRAEKTAFRLVA